MYEPRTALTREPRKGHRLALFAGGLCAVAITVVAVTTSVSGATDNPHHATGPTHSGVVGPAVASNGTHSSAERDPDAAVTAPKTLAEVEAILGLPVRAARVVPGEMTERHALSLFGHHSGGESAADAAYSLGFAEVGFSGDGTKALTWRPGWIIVSDLYRGDYYDSSTASETSASPAATPTKNTPMREVTLAGIDGDFAYTAPFKSRN